MEKLVEYSLKLLHSECTPEVFCVIQGLHKVLSVNVQITQINCLGMNCPIAHTSVTQKNCFRIIYVIISRLIVRGMS